MPGWTWIDDEVSEEQIDSLTPTLNALANEWTAITREIEQEGWTRQARIEDGDYDEPDCDEEDCSHRNPCAFCKSITEGKQQREANRDVKLEIIEGLLEKYGARMMRPYEHWNEDERYMEYQERDRY
jgi:hypothetical protein